MDGSNNLNNAGGNTATNIIGDARAHLFPQRSMNTSRPAFHPLIPGPAAGGADMRVPPPRSNSGISAHYMPNPYPPTGIAFSSANHNGGGSIGSQNTITQL